MMTSDRNIYQTARISSGLTQERAAELIGVSVRSLAAYEGGERIPADDVIVRMADVYNTQFLAYQHLRNTMEAARSVLPDVTPQSLAEAVLRLQKEINDFLQIRDTLIEIACDGVITDEEQPLWEKCLKEADEVGRAVTALKFAIVKAAG